MRILFVKQQEDNSVFSYRHYLIRLFADTFSAPIFFYDKHSAPVSGNHFLVVSETPKPSILGYQRWYGTQLIKIIKDLQIEKIVYLNGYCPALQGVTQILVIDNSDVLKTNFNIKNKWLQFSNSKLLESFDAAGKVFTFSEKIKNKITEISLQASEKTMLVPLTVKENRVFPNWEQQSKLKEQLTDGCEYFLNLTEQDSVEKIIHLLKAFSQFKKWQKSSMKLLLMCHSNLKNNNELNDKINSYKYKEDVQLLFELNREKLIQLLSAAYGFIYFSSEESAVLPVLIAMQSEAPVITNVQLFNEETSSESAFFLKDNSIEALGKAMIGLYKAESLRAILIKQGLAQTAQFSYKDVLEKIKLLLN